MNRLVKFARTAAVILSGRYRFPPGRMRYIEAGRRKNRRFLLQMHERFGPVFRLWWRGNHTTFVVGHERGGRLLADNEAHLSCATVDATPFFPSGFIRAMEGPTHRKYRRMVVGAIAATPVSQHEKAIRGIFAEALERCATVDATAGDAGQRMRAELRFAARRIMLLVFFGVDDADPAFNRLMSAYQTLGPEHPATNLRPQHAPAFAALQSIVEGLATRIGEAPDDWPSCFLKPIVTTGALDATAIGNLGYMVEPAHFDTHSLWRWIWKHLADQPDVVSEARRSFAADRSTGMTYARAIVNETLRLAQSEALVRNVNADISFEGFHIPKGSRLQLCLWEAHKDLAAFDDPFQFDPGRFLTQPPGQDRFAPFGLGRHQCPGTRIVLDTSVLFVEELVTRYTWNEGSDGDPVLGAFHWEPSPAFAVDLHRRENAKEHTR